NGAPRPPHGPCGGDHLGLERHRRRKDGGLRASRHRGDAAPGGCRTPAQGAAVKLRDILKPEHIVVPLQATTVKQATERLAERLVAAGAVADPQRLNAVIRHTWPEDMVSVGEHAFLPHFRTEAVRSLATAPSSGGAKWLTPRSRTPSAACPWSPPPPRSPGSSGAAGCSNT